MKIPILGIKYDDENPASYGGVTLRMLDKGEELFFSGDPTVDYHTAMNVIFKRCKDAGVSIDDIPIQGSSSVDHFVMDGGELRDTDPTDEEFTKAILAAKKHLGIPT